MAGAGYKVFVAGDKVTAAEVNTYLMQQAVMVFGSSGSRTSAIGTANFTDGMVSYITATDSLEIYDGSNWQVLGTTAAWTSYTPTLTNLTLGNGTLSFAYQTQGKTVNVRGRFTLGSTSAVSGSATFSLPTTPTGFAYGMAFIVAGGANYIGQSTVSSTNVVVTAVNAAGTYATRVSTSSTIPGTFTTGDQINFSLTYETA